MYGITRKIILSLTLVLILASCSSKSKEAEVEPTATVPTGSTNDTSLNSTLFSTTTAGDSLPVSTSTSTTTTATAPVSSTAQACLSGTSLSSSSSTSLQSACYDVNAPYRSDLDLFNMGLSTFGSLDACVSFIRNSLQSYCTASTAASAADQASKMTAARMGLVRCFRNVLAQQTQFAQWQPDTRQNFNNNDGLLYALLQAFAAGNK